jgi:hypothetical protein
LLAAPLDDIRVRENTMAIRTTWSRASPALAATLGLVLLSVAGVSAQHDPLLSWNDGPTRQSIIAFVGKVTTAGSADFVPASERVAVFDNDGTL